MTQELVDEHGIEPIWKVDGRDKVGRCRVGQREREQAAQEARG